MAANTETVVFCCVAVCGFSLEGGYRSLKGVSCIRLQDGWLNPQFTSDKTARCYNPQDHNLNPYITVHVRKYGVSYADVLGSEVSAPPLGRFIAGENNLWYTMAKKSLTASTFLLINCWSNLRPWRWEQYAPSKLRWTSNGLHDVTYQKALPLNNSFCLVTTKKVRLAKKCVEHKIYFVFLCCCVRRCGQRNMYVCCCAKRPFIIDRLLQLECSIRF
jgi:hypothetical protein